MNTSEPTQLTERLRRHQKRILENTAAERTFPIIDTCRPDNGGILRLPQTFQKMAAEGFPEIAAFVPAAGAASRYLAPLTFLSEERELLEQNVTAWLEKMRVRLPEQIATWHLPQPLQGILRSKNFYTQAEIFTALQQIESPKALFPCVEEHLTFLQMKALEHAAMSVTGGEVFIAPPEQSASFRANLQALPSRGKNQTVVLEQAQALSTIRFQVNGEPVRNPDGNLSFVAAGHGALRRLFPDVQAAFPEVSSIFIRNIDNVSGTQKPVLLHTHAFLHFHRYLWQQMEKLRQYLKQQQMTAAQEVALDTLAKLGLSHLTLEKTIKQMPWYFSATDTVPSFWQQVPALTLLQLGVFQTPPDLLSSPASLTAAFMRPLSTMGQVPNTGGDVGGTPVFAMVDGKPQKLCLEVSHASGSDKQQFLQNPQKATHFNPVHVALELGSGGESLGESHPFWLIARKKFRGQEVFYHESLLYEMLGSSRHYNIVFVEIPRELFNPHKILDDAAGKRRSFWLADS